MQQGSGVLPLIFFAVFHSKKGVCYLTASRAGKIARDPVGEFV